MALGILIRKVKTEDREQIVAILRAAFDRPDEAKLVETLWHQHAIKLERLAEIGGIVAGYICYSGINTKPDLDGIMLGLGPLAVAPDRQNQGVGDELVRETLKIAHATGARLIAVLGEPDYYGRFGFEPASNRKMSWAGFDAGDAFQIISGDAVETDEIRTIHYHPAFEAVS